MKSQSRQLLETMDKTVQAPSTGFVENYQTALGRFIDEDQSTSKWFKEEPLRELDKTIYDSYDEGIITDDDINANTRDGADGPEWDKDVLVSLINERTGSKHKNATETRDSIHDELKMRRAYADRVHSNARFSGVVGKFAGSFNAAMMDPATYPTYFIGLGPAAHGANWARRAIVGAVKVGAAEGAIEAVFIQPKVYSWKKEIGVDYSVKDAVMSVATVVLGAGALTAAGPTVKQLSKGIKKFLAKHEIIFSASAEGQRARKDLEKTQELLKDSPNPDGSAKEELEIVTSIRNGIEQDNINPPKVEEPELVVKPEDDVPGKPVDEVAAKVEAKAKAEAEAKEMAGIGDFEVEMNGKVMSAAQAVKNVDTQSNVIDGILGRCP